MMILRIHGITWTVYDGGSLTVWVKFSGIYVRFACFREGDEGDNDVDVDGTNNKLPGY